MGVGIRSVEYGHGAGPASRSAANLMWKTTDDEAVGRQGLEVVQLLEVTVADVPARLVAFPQKALVAGFGELLGCVREGRVPAPGVGTRQAHAALQQIHG